MRYVCTNIMISLINKPFQVNGTNLHYKMHYFTFFRPKNWVKLLFSRVKKVKKWLDFGSKNWVNYCHTLKKAQTKNGSKNWVK